MISSKTIWNFFIFELSPTSFELTHDRRRSAPISEISVGSFSDIFFNFLSQKKLRFKIRSFPSKSCQPKDVRKTTQVLTFFKKLLVLKKTGRELFFGGSKQPKTNGVEKNASKINSLQHESHKHKFFHLLRLRCVFFCWKKWLKRSSRCFYQSCCRRSPLLRLYGWKNERIGNTEIACTSQRERERERERGLKRKKEYRKK